MKALNSLSLFSRNYFEIGNVAISSEIEFISLSFTDKNSIRTGATGSGESTWTKSATGCVYFDGIEVNRKFTEFILFWNET